MQHLHKKCFCNFYLELLVVYFFLLTEVIEQKFVCMLDGVQN